MSIASLFLIAISIIGICVGEIIPTYEYLSSLHELRSLQNPELLYSFASFVEKYNKSYSNSDEVIYRVNVFQERVEEARKLNEKSQMHGKNAATFGITKFSDLTKQEFKDKYLMKNMPVIPKEKRAPNHLEPLSSIQKINGTQPSSFDWAQTPGTVTPVYNQGQCGSCWAFSATENHESRWARQHNEAAQEMSVQQILDCDSPGQYGCNGGWPYQAWDYIYSQGGQDQLSCYPYQGQVGSCQWNGGCNVGSLVSWTWIFPNNEEQQLLWLYRNAPISICVDAEQWSSYNGGIVYASECGTQTDHCVLTTGYNLNSNPPYWIVRNSWGTDWGINGYIWLQYGADTCAMAQYAASCHTVNGN